MKLVVSLIGFSLACLPVQAQINSPKIGTARYQDGSLHSVQGLADNLIVGNLAFDSAQTVSFSDAGGLIAQNGTISLLDADLHVVAQCPGERNPLVSLEGGLTSALAWLPDSHTLLHWSGSNFEAFSLPDAELEGTVTGLQSAGAKLASLIVQHPDDTVSRVTVSLRTGNLVTSEVLPGVSGYAFSQGLFYIFASNQELVADTLHGYRRSLPLPASDFVIERMSNTWLHLYSPKLQQHWALHLNQADLHLSMLPGLPDRQAATLLNATVGIK